MVQVKINPVDEIPFATSGGWWCNACRRRSKDFYHSAVRTGYRRCRKCHRAVMDKKQAQRTKVDALVRKLKYNLKYQRRPKLAKGVSRGHVLQILKHNGIEYDDQLDSVKTISPSFDPSANQWDFNVVFNTVQVWHPYPQCIYKKSFPRNTNQKKMAKFKNLKRKPSPSDAGDPKHRCYSKPSRMEMILHCENFVHYQTWQEKVGYNHFGNDVVSFLGPRQSAYDEHDISLLQKIWCEYMYQ